MNYKSILNQEELNGILNDNLGVLLYFSKKTCNVGEALEPKINNLLKEKFPKIPFYFVDMDLNIETATKYNVFVEPTILVFFDGKETIRKSRNFSVIELSKVIERIYKRNKLFLLLLKCVFLSIHCG